MVVVGAGIAGLTAGYLLREAGFQVTVCEAASGPGGRMSSLRRDGLVLDHAAQVVSSGYEVVGRLLSRTGLASELLDVPQGIAFVRGGRAYAVDPSNPLSIVGSGLIGWRELPYLRAFLGGPEMAAAWAVSRKKDVAAWAALDFPNVDRWARETVGPELSRYMLEPALAALYFENLEGVSFATLASVGFSLVKDAGGLRVVRGGIGSLPERLAEGLDVRYGMAVREVIEEGSRVRVVAQDGVELQADSAVVAVPAPVARTVYAPRMEAERSVLATPYSSAFTLMVEADPAWADRAVPPGVNSVFVPRTERDLVYMIFADSTNAYVGRRSGRILKFLLSGPGIEGLWGASPEQVFERVAAEAGPYLPGLREGARALHVTRLREAMPTSGPGRFRRIRDYRRDLKAGRRVVLAGDYLSTITTDGAAESGYWAARQISSRVFLG